jgi:predicted GIY-YIG superfamily endonuclease
MKHVPRDLYPMRMPAHLYLGMGGGCSWEGPGFFYQPCEWESDRVTLIETLVVWSAPKSPEVSKQEGPAVRTALYRLRADDGGLLYVGISEAPLRRWPEHASDKEWWPEVTSFSLEWFETRDAALAAEASAIRAEAPKCNVTHNSACR